MNSREITTGRMLCEGFDARTVGLDPVAWLEGQAGDKMLFLAHADDGVLWGRVDGREIRLAPPGLSGQTQLRPETLQMARLFDPTSEVFVWRTSEHSWQARRLTDGAGEDNRYFDEDQILWGTRVEASEEGFALVAEGEQGLRHAIPLDLQPQDWQADHPLRLGVRHYLAADEVGWLRVAMSRLTGLTKEKTR